jgi:predicted dehydrogenase
MGTGHWAREVHAAALTAHPEVDLVGVWGRDPHKASALAQTYQVRAFAEIDALLRQVDAVAFALPPQIQAGLAVRAARAGKHLLLDKPLALSVADADAVVSEVRARKLASVVFFTSRYLPTTAAALAQAVETGGWHGGHATHFGSIYTEGNPYAESLWRHEHGGLWDIGPHALAALLPVLGRVRSVVAVTGPRQTSHVTLVHAGGAVSTMALTLDAPPVASKVETVFHGESGWLALPQFDASPTAALETAITQLIAAVPRGEHPLDVRFGRDVVAILAAAETSAKTGARVDVG